MTARLRLYNGGWEALHFMPDDIWLAPGDAEDPPGPVHDSLLRLAVELGGVIAEPEIKTVPFDDRAAF